MRFISHHRKAARLLAVSGLLLPWLIAPAVAQSDALVKEYDQILTLVKAGKCAEILPRAELLAETLQSSGASEAGLLARHLHVMGLCQVRLNYYAEAEPLYRRALVVGERFYGPIHGEVNKIHVALAQIYVHLNRPDAAEEQLKAMIAACERAHNASPDRVHAIRLAAVSLDAARVYFSQMTRSMDAELLSKKAIALLEKATDPRGPELALALQWLAVVLMEQGRDAEAEPVLRRALDILERPSRSVVSGLDDPRIGLGIGLSNLGSLYYHLGRNEEAVALMKRGTEIALKGLKPGNVKIGQTLADLGYLYTELGRYTEAEPLLKQAIASDQDNTTKDGDGSNLYKLGLLYLKMGRLVEAETVILRTIDLNMKYRGSGGQQWNLSSKLHGLAEVYRLSGRFAEAEPIYYRALDMLRGMFGDRDARVAEPLIDLARLNLAMGRTGPALEFARESTQIAIGTLRKGANTGLPYEVAKVRSHFEVALEALQRRAQEKVVGAAGAEEAFVLAQWASQSAAANALGQMAARFATSDSVLGQLVREHQDTASESRALEKAQIGERANAGQPASADAERLKGRRATVDWRLQELSRRLAESFPGYAALTSPEPLAVRDAQALLAHDESLVFLLTGEMQSYVFALTRDGFQWHAIAAFGAALAGKVAGLRRGIELEDAKRLAGVGLFELEKAHELYETLLAPIEPLIKDKRHLIIVPTGALTSLPFQLLLTKKPPVGTPNLTQLAAYRDASWLIKRHALTVLPSVANLKALRSLGKGGQGANPFIGYGDPVFRQTVSVGARRSAKTLRSSRTRAYGSYFRGGRADLKTLGEGLAPLPETVGELRAVAKQLGASDSDIRLGLAATETAVKRADLSSYRVVYFATHGLVAGEIQGLAEPALALTLPNEATELDDGLLTASEVAQLKLNADWVVLSACNTAAGDKPGAEALSGLARAFFYAGARALLVSHWRVDSEAAARLSTSTFEALQKDPSIGRAEALRHAMLDYMNDTSNPWNAYPDYWGPFSVVGEGGAKR